MMICKSKVLVVALLLLFGCQLQAQSSKVSDDGFKTIFNGENFDGWYLKIRANNDSLAQKVFAIEDGMVHVFNDEFPDNYKLNTKENDTHGLFLLKKATVNISFVSNINGALKKPTTLISGSMMQACITTSPMIMYGPLVSNIRLGLTIETEKTIQVIISVLKEQATIGTLLPMELPTSIQRMVVCFILAGIGIIMHRKLRTLTV